MHRQRDYSISAFQRLLDFLAILGTALDVAIPPDGMACFLQSNCNCAGAVGILPVVAEEYAYHRLPLRRCL